jgi:hypothetical protein
LSLQHPNPPVGPDDEFIIQPGGPTLDEFLTELLADSAPRTVRICRHCGELAAVARLQSEPLCPVGEAFGHSYHDLPVAS